jgi:20S proteasome alpha/beta subunit
MTVCIGLVCNSGKRILLAADTRASYGAATSNDQAAKLFDLPAHSCGAVAGTLSQCEDVISELYHRMAQYLIARLRQNKCADVSLTATIKSTLNWQIKRCGTI